MEESIRKSFDLSGRAPETYSPLTLAYIGDAVYELIIRTVISEEGEASAKAHTKKGTQLAKAVTQAQMARGLIADDFLTEEEQAVYKRGRNTSITHSAKNATVSEYRAATGLEALIGWLFIQNRDGRMFELVRRGWETLQ